MIKKVTLGTLLLALLVLAIIVLRTFMLTPDSLPLIEPENLEVDSQEAVGRLSQAIQFKTISQVLPAKEGKPAKTLVDENVFTSFHQYLLQAYPKLHQHLDRQILQKFSMLYTWPGTDTSKAPIVLMAHQDVVPFAMTNLDVWKFPPFSGAIEEGYIWGRGTLDDKSSMMAIMEAVENLVKTGWQPSRTIYLAFGHDEEVGGTGAAAIAAYFEKQGIKPGMVLDEGGFVMRSVIPGVSQPVGLIGIAEKGYLSVKLKALGQGGHSSMPPPHTAAGIIAAAVARLEQNPPAMRLDGATRELFDAVSPYMSFGKRAVFANLWLFEPVVLSILESKESSNATVRTTQAVTMLNSGQKDNVLPSSASAVINYRLLPEDSVEVVMEHIRQIVNDDRISIEAYPYASEASRVSSTDNPLFRALVGVSLGVFRDQEVVMAPYLTIGATDARHYQRVSDNQYRFLPIPLTGEDLPRIHGPNERIAVDDYLRMIQFYVAFIRQSGRE
ncbi:hypothetical protein BTA51_26900 [Hahella sp. CCB-MM4]|uniref:M20 family peptidase n=1 Tax=Hahella sp. (strain CCB-MM4) TaxID=1926491 RepID=UPI000B9A3A8F|nr:M20 family peptidase [Hahella sp. CCB-MM4]OZG70233.1 hypothetical protein BTA51_26900 [Hahella sp. CCB-MM4]